MSEQTLKLLSMAKYEGMLMRAFAGATSLEIRDLNNVRIWQSQAGGSASAEKAVDDTAAVSWSAGDNSLERRRLPSGQLQFRYPISLRARGRAGWIVAIYDTQSNIALSSAMESIQQAFTDVATFIQEELELQLECNQLAVELTERYEELNLVYSTKDQVEHFEEGQEALSRLVHNCADYLDVGFVALICRDRGLSLHETNRRNAPPDTEAALNILSTTIYNHIESQVQSLVINESDDELRARLFAGRDENLLAYPIIDDYGTTIGILAVVARRELHTFSNGDRNLLEVMAKKASRIIHTHHDALTGLINRSGFESSLMTTLATTRSKNQQHCLLHIDIDQLRVINDLMGYQEGDNLIRRIAKQLRGLLRDSDILARLGGDEFVVLLTNCDMKVGVSIADKIRSAMHDIIVVSGNKQLGITASIGVIAVTRETDGIMTVMASAEIACRTAKEGGNDRIQVFEEDNTALLQRSEEIEWIGRIQQALRDDMFVLHCQPVLPIRDETQPEHFEMLVRMLDENGEILSPALFMPAAERYQLMPQLDRWVIRNSLAELKSHWAEIGPSGAVFCINLSGQSLTNSGFLAFIAQELETSGIAPAQICFEITETAAISNIDEAIEFIAVLQDIGCRFALDDFGAGLSSFGYLKVLPVNYLKIDGSFIRELNTDRFSASMVNAICQIGRTMGLSMIAEYVGDAATVDKLREIGVDYGQGFFLGKPQPLTEVTERLCANAHAVRA
ncbi:MAG: EAL domain-containing protein [Woeseia sp.]